MNCIKCNRILAEIRFLDAQVKLHQDEKDFQGNKFTYSLIYNEHVEIRKDIHLIKVDSTIEYKKVKERQIEVHKRLTKHYRNRHLDV